MRGVAKFAMRGPAAASFSATAYALLALFFAPFMIVSGAILNLVTLRHGIARGFQLCLFVTLAAGAAYYGLTQRGAALLLFVFLWTPALLAAALLRRTANQGLALTVCALSAAIYALAVRTLVPDLTNSWIARLQALGESVRGQGGTFFDDKELAIVAAVMHEATIVLVCLYWAITVLTARWWQASLYNPGGFGTEFREFVVPRWISPVAAAVAIFGLIQTMDRSNNQIASDLIIILVVLFAFQGLAVIHHRVKKLELSRWWPIGMYVLLTLIPHRVGLILAFIGIADTLADFRQLRGARRSS